MSQLSRLTIVVHTSDRPHFVTRLLDHFERIFGGAPVRVLLLEASSEENWAAAETLWRARDYSLAIRTIRGSRASPFYDRLRDGLTAVDTPYVVLAADDDLYFLDWLKDGVDCLDNDGSIGTIYGHTLKFELESYAPYGKELNCYFMQEENPPRQWLDDHCRKDRLRAFGGHPLGIATTGWYALQRTNALRRIVTLAREHDIRELFEYFFGFGQVALGRTHMVDRVYIARQVDRNVARPPMSRHANQAEIERLDRASQGLLVGIEGVDGAEAETLIGLGYASLFNQMARADKKRHLRSLASRYPILRTAWDGLIGAKTGKAEHQPDPRLPRSPPLQSCGAEERIISNAIDTSQARRT